MPISRQFHVLESLSSSDEERPSKKAKREPKRELDITSEQVRWLVENVVTVVTLLQEKFTGVYQLRNIALVIFIDTKNM